MTTAVRGAAEAVRKSGKGGGRHCAASDAVVSIVQRAYQVADVGAEIEEYSAAVLAGDYPPAAASTAEERRSLVQQCLAASEALAAMARTATAHLIDPIRPARDGSEIGSGTTSAAVADDAASSSAAASGVRPVASGVPLAVSGRAQHSGADPALQQLAEAARGVATGAARGGAASDTASDPAPYSPARGMTREKRKHSANEETANASRGHEKRRVGDV